MLQYTELMADVIQHGEQRDDRTGTGTKAVFGRQMRFDFKDGFPAMTTKTLAWNAVVGELLWFLKGSTNVEELRDITHGKNSDKWCIWDPNYNDQAVSMGYTDGELGPVYGKQWRDFFGIDQIKEVIKSIKENPMSRRHIVSAWNPKELHLMALPPCHVMFQFYVSNDGKLSCHLYQRSVDVFLGLPFNIASYALLTCMIAQICDLEPGEFVWSGGDIHIYNDHREQCYEQMCRTLRPLPALKMPPFSSLDDILLYCKPSDFVLEGYDPHPPLKGKMSS